MENKLINIEKHKTCIILFGNITDPGDGGGGGGGGGTDPGGGGGSPTEPGTGGGGGEGTGDGMGGTLPHGTISTDGQEEGGTSFFAPPITSFVRFKYRSTSVAVPWTVKTKSLGTWKSNSGTSSFVVYRTLDVPIVASNVTVTVTFQTWDTNGGLCTWQAMHS